MNGTYSNPRPLTDLWDGHEIGDPFLMRFNGQYYLYCSSHGNGPGIKCWISRDMIEFTYAGYVCEDPRIEGAYAPEVCYVKGKFYMVTSPKGSGHYLLRAESPLGPFEVITENYGLGIDGSLFVDDDGKEYFYRASAQGIRVHEMPTPDLIDVHSRVIEASFLGHWTEGPMVIKRNGRYFLTDTGNHVLSKGYHVDYFVSHEKPDRGYYALKEQQLLLETRDEYHVLGHSSTCVGPDMDTMYIVYHKNILDAWNRPHHRSLCMDRLFFNGDRMFTNACWWNQKAPRLPVCASYDGEGLVSENGVRWLPKAAGDPYTAELCGTLNGESGKAVFSQSGEYGIELQITRSGLWNCTISDAKGQQAYGGELPSACDPCALLCVKVSLRDGKLFLYVNGLEILRADACLGGGRMGLSNDFAPGFMGFSDVAQGSEDGRAAKNIPGAFDAYNCQEAAETAEGEKNCAAVVIHAGATLSWPINVWKTGKYHIACTVRAGKEPLNLRINGVSFSAPSCGVFDEQGMERRYMGVMALPAGESVLTVQADRGAVIDRFYVLEADEFTPVEIIMNGNDVTGGALRVIGHKAKNSMNRKFSGYTCAEGYGEAYFGGMWRDYEAEADIHMDPCSPDAGACVYLRSSKESWHPHQVRFGRHAYCVRLLPGRIELNKQAYSEKILASASLHMPLPGTLRLICCVSGNTITVWEMIDENRIQLITFTDPMGLICGRVGIDASGDGIGFDRVSVRRTDE